MRSCHFRRRDRHCRGFTLIELSIVLVIIGLVAAGIVVGQNMIRSAEIRSVSTDEKRIEAALNAFKEKYGDLPGDLPNATGYWGSAGGTGAFSDSTCISAQSTATTPTCNGSGDGTVNMANLNHTVFNNAETFLVWKHLVDAAMFEGSYTGIAGSGGALNAVAGTNVAAGRIAGTGFTLEYEGQGDGTTFFNINLGHLLQFGLNDSVHETYNPALTNDEALSLDVKLDDGMPGSGVIVTRPSSSCTTSNVPATAQYVVSGSGLNCMIAFITGL